MSWSFLSWLARGSNSRYCGVRWDWLSSSMHDDEAECYPAAACSAGGCKDIVYPQSHPTVCVLQRYRRRAAMQCLQVYRLRTQEEGDQEFLIIVRCVESGVSVSRFFELHHGVGERRSGANAYRTSSSCVWLRVPVGVCVRLPLETFAPFEVHDR